MEEKIEIVIKEYVLSQLEAEYMYFFKEYSENYADTFYDSFFKIVENILPHYLSYPECRFLSTKNKTYRNIIWGNYLIVFKIKKKNIEVLCLFHTKQNPKKLKVARRIK
jgi:hypothetical protein